MPPLGRLPLGAMTARTPSAARKRPIRSPCASGAYIRSRISGVTSASMLPGTGAYAASSASSNRLNNGLSNGRTSGGPGARVSSTIRSRSVPRWSANACSLGSPPTERTSAVTGPGVAGDHGAACAMNTAVSGATMRTHTLRCSQPRPNSPQLSARTCESPICVSSSRAQSIAFFRLGEPVSRGPTPSISSVA